MTYSEVVAIARMTFELANKYASKPAGTIDEIILIENEITWRKRVLSFTSGNQQKLISIPISLARILHTRLQKIPGTPVNQMILQKLDYELVNRNYRPTQSIKI